MLDPTKRFSNRVENYVKYRPAYPPEIIGLLKAECGFTPASVIADMGSGTGILSEMFLHQGNRVFGVEPNREMRVAGEKLLAEYSKFSSIDATAEATTLVNSSIDFITAGQAFHWFDRESCRAEFARILKPEGWVALVWNGFRVETSPLNNAYQELVLKYGTDYQEVRREIVGCDIESFYAPGACRCAAFEFQQGFDFEGLKGRLLSSSYAPEQDHPNYQPILLGLQEIFDANQTDGKVIFCYETELYYGQLSAK
jgi:SAM-dependent methyltransferase